MVINDENIKLYEQITEQAFHLGGFPLLMAKGRVEKKENQVKANELIQLNNFLSFKNSHRVDYLDNLIHKIAGDAIRPEVKQRALKLISSSVGMTMKKGVFDGKQLSEAVILALKYSNSDVLKLLVETQKTFKSFLKPTYPFMVEF